MTETKGAAATQALDYCCKTSYRKCITISDADIRVYELGTNVCLLNWYWAYTCLVLNVVVPGTGTILMSILGDPNINKTQFAIGVLQFLCWLTAIVMMGIFGIVKMGGFTILEWCWSIYWGALIVWKTHTASEEQKRLLAADQPRSD